MSATHRHTCDQLATCQGRTPRCDGCNAIRPAPAMRTPAQLIAHIEQLEVDEMNHQARQDQTQAQRPRVRAGAPAAQGVMSEGTASSQTILRHVPLTADNLLLMKPPPVLTQRATGGIYRKPPKSAYGIDRSGPALRLVEKAPAPTAATEGPPQTHRVPTPNRPAATVSKPRRIPHSVNRDHRQLSKGEGRSILLVVTVFLACIVATVAITLNAHNRDGVAQAKAAPAAPVAPAAAVAAPK